MQVKKIKSEDDYFIRTYALTFRNKEWSMYLPNCISSAVYAFRIDHTRYWRWLIFLQDNLHFLVCFQDTK